MKQTKVFIVDDSLLFREMLHRELERDPNVKVVAKASDPLEASRRIVESAPDVLIADVWMDKMNGIDFVRQLLPQYFLPAIIVSSDPANRPLAESIESVLFVDKPSDADSVQASLFFHTLLAKIRTVAGQEVFDLRKVQRVENKLIAIGASTGGAEALEILLTKLPSTMPPILVSQHMPPKFTKSFAERLNNSCSISVIEAKDGDLIMPGVAYIAPGGYHMSIRQRKNKYYIHCEENASQSPICPNIDMLFDSVAKYGPAESMGVLLTGMGRDGAKGLKAIRDAGRSTIGQDEESSVVYGMPKAAFDIGAVETQLPLQQIPQRLIKWAWER